MRVPTKFESEATENLIRMTFYCHGHPITAVIDTGSEINVVNSTIATERIPLPMDTRSTTTMGDANGGEGFLKGLINGVHLTCGAVKTVCDIFVGDTVPFDLLLGRPWQIRNRVSIDERRAGTYLVFKDEEDVPRYEVRVPPDAFLSRPSPSGKRNVQTITVVRPPASLSVKDTEELEKLLEEPGYRLPEDSAIQVSSYETQWLEDLIDPLSKIVTNGRATEEKEILGKFDSKTLQPDEAAEEISSVSKKISRVLDEETSEACWVADIKRGSSGKVKVYSNTQKTRSQNEISMPQQQYDSPERGSTVIDLTGNSRNIGKTESVSLELNGSTSENLLDLMIPIQAIKANTGPQNKPSPPKNFPEMLSSSTDSPGPPTFAEAFVANQHGHRLIEALPYFSDELMPLTLSGQQGRLMGIGLEQNSQHAFAEFALANVQLSLRLDNELIPLEGEAYIMLRYPRDDRRPWNALFSCRSASPSTRNSPNPSIDLSSDGSCYDPESTRSDQFSANSDASTKGELPSRPFIPTTNDEPGAPRPGTALVQSLQKPLPSALSDNESQCVPTKSNERDRLVVPVLSCSLSPPSSPIATATPSTLSTSTNLRQLLSIVARRLEMEETGGEGREEPEEFDFVSRTFIISFEATPETNLQARPVYETVSPTPITLSEEPARRLQPSQPLVLATTLQSAHSTPPPAPSTPPFSTLRQLLSIAARMLEEEEREDEFLGNVEEEEIDSVSRTFLITIDMPQKLTSPTQSAHNASPSAIPTASSPFVSMSTSPLSSESASPMQISHDVALSAIPTASPPLVSMSMILPSPELTSPRQFNRDVAPSAVPVVPAVSLPFVSMSASSPSPTSASPRQFSHNTTISANSTATPTPVSMSMSPPSPASTLPIQPAHDTTSSAVPVPLTASPPSARPLVFATTMGPIRPPSPSHIGAIPLPPCAFDPLPEPGLSAFVDLTHRVGFPSTRPSRHEFVFKPNYVLAYGPFDAFNPTKPNDPIGRPIDYCVYLFPNHGRLDSRDQFIYGGSRIHPAQLEDLPVVLPFEQIIESFDWNTVRFIKAVSDLFRRGASPTVKIRIPRQLLTHPCWEESNLFGNIVHHSPHIEALLQIASSYVHFPVGIVAQALRQIHPEFDMFEDYRITCVCPDCEDYLLSDDDDDADADDNSDPDSEEMDRATTLPSVEHSNKEETDPPSVTLPISRPRSAPPQLPPSPRSRSPETRSEDPVGNELDSDCNCEMSEEEPQIQSFRPVVLAMTLGPIRPVPPPQIDDVVSLPYYPPHPLRTSFDPSHVDRISDSETQPEEQSDINTPLSPALPLVPEGQSGSLLPQCPHNFIFKSNYIFAYGPFPPPQEVNDSSSRIFDYRVYLCATNENFNPQADFIYGGSSVHPSQLERFAEMLPPIYFLERLDPLSLQFLNKLVDLFRRGAPPDIMLPIPHELMGQPTWVGPNTLGNVVQHLPHIEALLHIATSYVHHPMGTYSQILQRIHPTFDPIGKYQGIGVCQECSQLSNEEEEGDESMSEWSEEYEDEPVSPLSSTNSLSILRPHSAPPLMPPSPRSRLHEVLGDKEPECQREAATIEEPLGDSSITQQAPVLTQDSLQEASPTNEDPLEEQVEVALALPTFLRAGSSPAIQPTELTLNESPQEQARSDPPYVDTGLMTASQHKSTFEPKYIWAYGPYEKPFLPVVDRDEARPFDYFIYLYPSSGRLRSEVDFVYGGSTVHPAQFETFPRFLPSVQFIASFSNLDLIFLREFVCLFQRGAPPEMKLQVPIELITHTPSTWMTTNLYGNVVSHSPYLEALLHIAANYVHHPEGPYSRLLRHLHPRFDSNNEYSSTGVFPLSPPLSPHSRLHNLLETESSEEQEGLDCDQYPEREAKHSAMDRSLPLSAQPKPEHNETISSMSSPSGLSNNRTGIEVTAEEGRRVESECIEGRDSMRRGVSGTDVGILGYGPFNPAPGNDQSVPEYRFYLHRTTEHDALDLFAYGGPRFENDSEVLLFRPPTSPYVRDSSLDITEAEHAFFEEVENYLSGESHHDGIPIPQHLLGRVRQVIPGTRNDLQYRSPHFELVISTIAARFAHAWFSRTTNRQGLEGLRHLILPTYPLLHNNDLLKLKCPEIPYLLPKFEPGEPRHSDEIGESLPIEYFGCLPRKEAYIFQQTYPHFSDNLYYTALATRELLLLHSPQAAELPIPAEIDWKGLLDPFPFHLVFEEDRTPEALMERIQQLTPGEPNYWLYRIPYIIQSCRQVSLLIQQLETFFQTLGF